MADKKYYWLKLKDNFFEDDTIAYLEEQENGVQYVNFYLKLCLKSIRNEGKLIRLIGETFMPYDYKSLAKLTNTNIDTVRTAMEAFEAIGLIKKLDTGEFFLAQINEMIGSETAKAELMRRKRAQDKIDGNNVTTALPERYTEIEIEIEKDIDIDIESREADEKHQSTPPKSKKDKPVKHRYGEFNHVLLSDIEYKKLVDTYTEYYTRYYITQLDEYIEEKRGKSNNHYLTIRKWIGKDHPEIKNTDTTIVAIQANIPKELLTRDF